MSSQKQDARLLCFYLIYQSFDGFPGGSVGEGSACSAGHLVSIPELGRSPGGRHGNPLQCSCLENPPRQRSLAGYRPWGCKQSDMTKRLRTNSIRVLKTIYLTQFSVKHINFSLKQKYFQMIQSWHAVNSVHNSTLLIRHAVAHRQKTSLMKES